MIAIDDITSYEKMAEAVRKCGFLPLFANGIRGFSVEEHTPPEYWFSDNIDGPWEWKGTVIRKTNCVYGKFFGGKTSFISREWFSDFANYRRDGYDYDALCDEGLARYGDKSVYDTLVKFGSLLSKDLRFLSGYTREKKQRFEAILARLQEKCYVVIDDFIYATDCNGNRYGWGIARYTTPETLYGQDFTDKVYQCSPEQSKIKISEHLSTILPDIPTEKLLKFIR